MSSIYKTDAIDASTSLCDTTDTSKRIKFDIENISTSTTRTLTVANANTTLVGTDIAQTLANKTLTLPIISTISNTGTLTLPTSTDTLVGRATTDTLTNKTLTDALTFFQDNADETKKLQLQLSGITTATTRILTVPDANTTIVGTDTVQTLTNKTISGPLLDIDNIRLDANTISSTDINGNINILPNGTGDVVLKANPTNILGAATKQYVDSIATSLTIKQAVRTKTDATLPAYTQAGAGIGATLTADVNGSIPTIDGVTMATSDRILVDTAGTTSDIHNGIYTVTQLGDGSNPWILTRTTDADQDTEVIAGLFIIIKEGNTYANTAYVLTTPNPITVDTTSQEFVQLNSVVGAVTGSNIGTDGIGLYKEIIGGTLKFKKINAKSSKVTITDDTGNDEIDIDLIEGNIVIGNLNGAPTSSVVGISDAQTLTNKTLTDASTYFQDDTDNTKKLQLQLSGITTATTRTLTVPNASITLVGTDNAQTLTNKTLTAPIISTISNSGTITLPTGAQTLVGRTTTDTLTNKTLTAPIISTISNSGTITLPTGTQTLVGKATTDTLTNKTLTAPIISTISNTGTLTLPTSTDTLVGRTTTDTLTNKILNSSTNTITTDKLRSATTIIDIASATAPASGQILTATSSTVAAWQNPGISAITNVPITATTATSTSSTSYITIVGMTTTPASGKYLVTFSSSGSTNNGGNDCDYAIHIDGDIVSHSRRSFAYMGAAHTNDYIVAMHTQAVITVNGSQAINVKYQISNGTFTLLERSMILLKLS